MDGVPYHLKHLYPLPGSDSTSSEDNASVCEGEEILVDVQDEDSPFESEKKGPDTSLLW